MNQQTKVTVRIAYTLLIALVCIVLALLAAAFGRWHGLIYAVFFGYTGTVLASHEIMRWRYKCAADALNFIPLQRGDMTYSVAAVIAEDGRRDGCISDAYGGKLNGIDVQTFCYSLSSAWWSKKQTVVAIPLAYRLSIDENARRALDDRANADLSTYQNWIIVRARQRNSPRQLPQWLKAVTEILGEAER